MFALTHKTPCTGIGAFLAQYSFCILFRSKKHKCPLIKNHGSGGFALLFAFSDVIQHPPSRNYFVGFWISTFSLWALASESLLKNIHSCFLFSDCNAIQRNLFWTMKQCLYAPHQDTVRLHRGFSIAAPILCIFFALFSQQMQTCSKQSSFLMSFRNSC